MKISLDKKTISQIETLLDKVTPDHEIEFRLGSIFPGKFVSGVTNFIFSSLLYKLIDLSKSGSINGPVYKKVLSKVTYYKNSDARKIEENGESSFQYKKKDMDVDIQFSNLDIRLSKSNERNVPNNSRHGSFLKEREDIEEISAVRQREKNIFSFKEFDIEISKVKNEFLPNARNISGETLEIEIELHKVEKEEKLSIIKFIDPLKIICEILFPERFYMIPKEDEIDIRNKRKSIKTSSFKPRNIKRKDIPYMKDYSVTNKLNGIGYDMIISDKGIHILNSTSVDKLVSTSLSEYYNTVIEGEWYNGGFYIFDCVAFRGQDISNKKHHERLKYLNDLFPLLQSTLRGICNVDIKKFIYTGNLANDTKEIMRYIYTTFGEDALKSNDGIMFQPMNGIPLKFKFPSTMSIDFEITGEKILLNSKIYTIRVYNKRNELVPFDGNYINKSGERTNLTINPTMIVKKDNELYNKLSNGLIVECLFNKKGNYFTPERIRGDKKLPNFIEVAIDVYRDMINPLQLDEMISMFDKSNKRENEEEKGEINEKNMDKGGDIRNSGDVRNDDKKSDRRNSGDKKSGDKKSDDKKESRGDCLIPMRKFHNQKKNELISKYTRDKTVLDLGFGKGGDLLKYSNAKTKFIFGVEPNNENLDEAKRRYADKKNNFQVGVKFINCKAQDLSDINEAMEYKKVDVVSSFFSLTFFFEREKELNALINTIAGNTKIGGYMIGTTMSGDELYKVFKGLSKIEYPGCYRIDKYYDDDDGEDLGKKIVIHLEDTIVTEQTEYLVFFNIFKERMEKRGFVLIESEFFDPPKNLKQTYELSKLNMSFVFQRVETAEEIRVRERALEEKKRLEEESKNSLKMADMDTNIAFKTPYLDRSLIRTGTVGDGSCFFHSILKSIEPKYSKLDSEERKDLVANLRNKLASELSMDRWETFGGGTLSFIRVIPRVVKYIKSNVPEIYDIAKELENSKNMTTIEQYYSSMMELISTEELKKRFSNIFKQLKKRVFEEFKVDLTKCSTWVGQEIGSIDVFEYISDYLNIDIYIIKDSTRAPYRQGVNCDIRYKNRKSVMVLWVGDSHYEAIGVLEGKKINRIFDPTDDIIKITREYVCPE